MNEITNTSSDNSTEIVNNVMINEVNISKKKLKDLLSQTSNKTLQEINKFMTTNVMPLYSSSINTATLIV
jgi:hypothetical protein